MQVSQIKSSNILSLESADNSALGSYYGHVLNIALYTHLSRRDMISSLVSLGSNPPFS